MPSMWSVLSVVKIEMLESGVFSTGVDATLNSSVIVVSGSGTYDDPYVIDIG